MRPLKQFEELAEIDFGWKIFNVTQKQLYEIVDSMSLGDSVPELVREQFQQAQYLIIYSTFQFTFLSVAFMQAHIAVECALRERWRRDFPSDASRKGPKPGLSKLLDIATTDRWFINTNPVLIENMPFFRNDLAHGGFLLSPVDTLDMVGAYGKFIREIFDYRRDSND